MRSVKTQSIMDAVSWPFCPTRCYENTCIYIGFIHYSVLFYRLSRSLGGFLYFLPATLNPLPVSSRCLGTWFLYLLLPEYKVKLTENVSQVERCSLDKVELTSLGRFLNSPDYGGLSCCTGLQLGVCGWKVCLVGLLWNHVGSGNDVVLYDQSRASKPLHLQSCFMTLWTLIFSIILKYFWM